MGLNPRQVKVLNRLLDGFEGKLSSSKYAAIGKCSSDTALRDINELLVLGLLQRLEGGGRGVSFEEVLAALDGDLLDVIDHPNERQYTHQKMLILKGYSHE